MSVDRALVFQLLARVPRTAQARARRLELLRRYRSYLVIVGGVDVSA